MTHTNLGEPTIYVGDTFEEGCTKIGCDVDFFDGSPTEELYVYQVNDFYLYLEKILSGEFFCCCMNDDIIGTQEECETFLWESMKDEIGAS